MPLSPHLSHPKHCFCQMSFELLAEYFYKRYVEGVSTLDLIAAAQTEEEKEVICVVATFEVDEHKLIEIMGDVNLPEHHILHCREAFRDKLEAIKRS